MRLILEALPGFYKVVSEELKLKGVEGEFKRVNETTHLLDLKNDEQLPLLRKLQTINNIEKILVEIPYVKSIKEFRRECRRSLIELRDYITKSTVVSARVKDVKRRRLLVILREIQRIFKCSLSRSVGDLDLVIRFLDDKYVVSLNIGTFQPLYRRWYTYHKSRASLHPSIAAAMSIIAGEQSRILDPFCGSLTIPIEYLRMWRRSYATCIDIDKKTIINSIKNAILSGTYDRMFIIVEDFFSAHLREQYDTVITDPPRGLRLESSIKLYKKFIEKSINILSENGKIVTIVFKRDLKTILKEIPKYLSTNIPLETVQGGYKVCILEITK
ncbi:MAG: methyltransferase [Crenarchaeota archaeon]|nr:methyltransferase [Thermoproteota archaeon]